MKKLIISILIFSTLISSSGVSQSGVLDDLGEISVQLNMSKKILRYIALWDTTLTEEQHLFIKKHPTAEPLFIVSDSIEFSDGFYIPMTITPIPGRQMPVIPNYYTAEIEGWYMTNGKDTLDIPLPPTFNEEEKTYWIYYDENELYPMALILSGQSNLSSLDHYVRKKSLRSAVYWRLRRYGVRRFIQLNERYLSRISEKPEKDREFRDWLINRYGVDSTAAVFLCWESNISRDPIIIVVTKTNKNSFYPVFGDVKLIYYTLEPELIGEKPKRKKWDGTGKKPPPPRRQETGIAYYEVITPVIADPKTKEQTEVQKIRIPEEDLEKIFRSLLPYRIRK